MGTKIHSKSYFHGFFSMRDPNERSDTSSWPVSYGDKTVSSGQYYNGFMSRDLVDGYPGHDKDTLKQKMLEHEAVFKNQVCELHRLYRIQRDMMEDAKRLEPASSSTHQGSQAPLQDARKWHMAGFSLSNSGYARTPIVGVENLSSPMSCMKGIVIQNGSSSKNSEALDSRPLKVRKRLFDLQLPADQYMGTQDEESLHDYKELAVPSCSKADGPMDASASTSHLRVFSGLADLNEPVQIEEAMAPSPINFLGHSSGNAETIGIHQPAKATAGCLGVTGDTMLVRDGVSIKSSLRSHVFDNGWFSHINKAGSSIGIHSSVIQGCHLDKLPLPYPNGYGREDMWRERFQHGLEPSERGYDHFNSTRLEPRVSRDPFFSSSSFWAMPKVNGLYHASASGSKKVQVQLQSAGFDYLNCSRDDDVASERLTNHGFEDFPKGAYHADLKPVIDINLNEVLPESPLIETVNGECHPEEKIVSNGRKNGIIDINVACEPDEETANEEPLLEKEKQNNRSSINDYIDLNSCVSEHEDSPPPCYKQKCTSVKIAVEIDVEVPVFLESEDETLAQSLQNQDEQIEDDVLRNAAETMVAISTCKEASTEEAMLWFVDAISSHENNSTSGKEMRIPDPSEEADDFEAMTLQLSEMKEEDYMPKPFVLEIKNAEETGAIAPTTRTRRGHSRRGRQRKDFQRDILPGLVLLSRYEMTGDLQTFGRLMRAMGHSWSLDLARKGGARGRRRAVVENVETALPTVEAGLEDGSLTGWGKTTRRPRRQRSPAHDNRRGITSFSIPSG